METPRVTCAVQLESVYEVMHSDFVDDIQDKNYNIWHQNRRSFNTEFFLEFWDGLLFK
jgi:hypothetical protein